MSTPARDSRGASNLRVGFHFDAHDPALPAVYGWEILKAFCARCLETGDWPGDAIISLGDLLLYDVAREKVPSQIGDECWDFRKDKYAALLQNWIPTQGQFVAGSLEEVIGKDVFVVCADGLTLDTANAIHEVLRGYSPYIGALEADTSALHVALYQSYLVPTVRFSGGRSIGLYWDGINEESKQSALKADLEQTGFEVSYLARNPG